jgi:hypothetical protein
MGKSDAAAKIFELTDIVEEGLPLDELPEIGARRDLRAEPVADDVTTAASAPAAGADETGFTGEDDFGLDLDDFSDLDLPESAIEGDPVLNELKNAGLKAQADALGTGSQSREIYEAESAILNEEADDLFDDDFDDLDDFDELLDETAVLGGKTDEKLSSESVQSLEPDAELPEDYLVGDELLAEDPATSKTDAQPQAAGKPESGSPVSPLRVDPVSASATHQIFTEPQALDFSQQIEDMTQEWSKQLLQTTYASMDKMIKAIGDLAPTIVDQVAREVIPPLAEKVIKAEIARLEEKLELEEGEEQ